LVAGGYGVAKGVVEFAKLVRMPEQVARLCAQSMHGAGKALKVGDFRYTKTASKHFAEVVTRGQYKGKLSRPYMGSPITVNEIMASNIPVPDPGGLAGGLRWNVPGRFRGTEGTWELVVDPESKIIYHFNFK
jgi:hypothetical protein